MHGPGEGPTRAHTSCGLGHERGRGHALKLDGRLVGEQIQDGAVIVHVLLEALVFGIRGRPLERDSPPDSLETGPHAVVNREEPAQVDVAFEGHGDAVERDPEVVRVEAVRDLLARCQGGEGVLNRARRRIGAGEGRRPCGRCG